MENKEGFSKIATQLVVLGVIVVAGGMLWYLTSGTPGTNLPTATSSLSTTTWTTFSNPAFGFTFQYPSEWGTPTTTLLSTRTRISFSQNDNFIVEDGGYYNQPLGRMLTLPEMVTALQGEATGSMSAAITLDGEPATAVVMPIQNGGEEVDIFASDKTSKTNAIHIGYAFDATQADAAQALLNEILSTFKLTTSTSTLQSLTITSPKAGDILQTGKTYRVSWVAIGQPTGGVASLDLINEATPAVASRHIIDPYNCSALGTCLSIESGEYNWTIPTSTAPGQYELYLACGKKDSNDEWCTDPNTNSGLKTHSGIFSIATNQ